MSTSLQIVIGANSWLVQQHGHTLFKGPADDAGIAALLQHLPPGNVRLRLDRPDEQLIQFECVAQQHRDRIRLARNRLSAQHGGAWGRVLVWPDASHAIARLVRLEAPALLDNLAQQLAHNQRGIALCHSHTLALAAAMVKTQGAVLVVKPGLVDGMRHVFLRDGQLLFTRLCPCHAGASSHTGLADTLQYLLHHQLWVSHEPLACHGLAEPDASLGQQYPGLTVHALATGKVALGRADLYRMPDLVRRHTGQLQAARILHRGSPWLSALALVGALFGYALSNSWVRQAAILQAQVPLQIKPGAAIITAELDAAALQALGTTLAAPVMVNTLQQVSNLISAWPQLTLQRVHWQLDEPIAGRTEAKLALDFSGAPASAALTAQIRSAAETAGWVLQAESSPAHWQISIPEVRP